MASIKVIAAPNASFDLVGECLDSHLKVQCEALPGAKSLANGPFIVERTNANGDANASLYTGTVTKLDGTTDAGFVKDDMVEITVTDDSGFERILKGKVP